MRTTGHYISLTTQSHILVIFDVLELNECLDLHHVIVALPNDLLRAIADQIIDQQERLKFSIKNDQ